VLTEFQDQAKQLYLKELSELPEDEKPASRQKKPTAVPNASGKKESRRSKVASPQSNELDLTLDDSDVEEQSQPSEGKEHELEEGQKQSLPFPSANTKGTGTSLTSEEDINLNRSMDGHDVNMEEEDFSGGGHDMDFGDEQNDDMETPFDIEDGNVLNTTAATEETQQSGGLVYTTSTFQRSAVLSSNENTIPGSEVVDNGKVAGRAEGGMNSTNTVSSNSASVEQNSRAEGGMNSTNTVSSNSASVEQNSRAEGGMNSTNTVSSNSSSVEQNSRAEGGMNSTNTVSSNSALTEQNLSTRNNINDTVHHQFTSNHPNNITGNHQYNNTSQGNDFGYDFNSLSTFMNERSGDKWMIGGCCGCIGCGMFLVGMMIYSSAMIINTVLNIYYLKD